MNRLCYAKVSCTSPVFYRPVIYIRQRLLAPQKECWRKTVVNNNNQPWLDAEFVEWQGIKRSSLCVIMDYFCSPFMTCRFSALNVHCKWQGAKLAIKQPCCACAVHCAQWAENERCHAERTILRLRSLFSKQSLLCITGGGVTPKLTAGKPTLHNWRANDDDDETRSRKAN